MTWTKNYSPWQFAMVRVLLGSYLLVHFIMLLPYGSELFSHRGLLPDPRSNPTFGLFPNILAVADSPWEVTGFVIVMTALPSFSFLEFGGGWPRFSCGTDGPAFLTGTI